MLKKGLAALLGLSIACAFLALGYYLGNSDRGEGLTVETGKRPAVTSEITAANVTDSPEVIVNINKATVEELCALEGIGPVIAARIIEYRELNGAFEHGYELLYVKGIGESVFRRIEACISID